MSSCSMELAPYYFLNDAEKIKNETNVCFSSLKNKQTKQGRVVSVQSPSTESSVVAFPSISPRGKLFPEVPFQLPCQISGSSAPCPALPLGDGCACSRALLPGAPSTHITLHIHTRRGTSFFTTLQYFENCLCAKSLHTESELLSVYVSALLFLCLVFCLEFTVF